jgi:hypothetical protein
MKEPEPYDGTHNAKMLGNFCWDMEQYLEQMNGSPYEAKVNIVAMFLTGTVKLWWRNQVEDLAARRITEKIENWAEMKEALKAQFGPGNQAWVARNQLLALRHTGKIQTYIKEFTGLMLEIKEMLDEDNIFHFMNGLQNWAQSELHAKMCKPLQQQSRQQTSSWTSRVKPKQVQATDEGQHEKQQGKKKKDKEKMKASKNNEEGAKPPETQKEKKPVSCWICVKENYAKNCPLKKKVNALEQEENPSVSVLQVLGVVVEAQPTITQDPDVTKLSYVQEEINGKMTLAMVDSGATHNFMREDIAQRLGLQFEQAQLPSRQLTQENRKLEALPRTFL